jgi:hypothetical protein
MKATPPPAIIVITAGVYVVGKSSGTHTRGTIKDVGKDQSTVFNVMFSWSAKVGSSALTGRALKLNKKIITKTRLEAFDTFIALNFPVRCQCHCAYKYQ